MLYNARLITQSPLSANDVLFQMAHHLSHKREDFAARRYGTSLTNPRREQMGLVSLHESGMRVIRVRLHHLL
jgi:hypothetical protein